MKALKYMVMVMAVFGVVALFMHSDDNAGAGWPVDWGIYQGITVQETTIEDAKRILGEPQQEITMNNDTAGAIYIYDGFMVCGDEGIVSAISIDSPSAPKVGGDIKIGDSLEDILSHIPAEPLIQPVDMATSGMNNEQWRQEYTCTIFEWIENDDVTAKLMSIIFAKGSTVQVTFDAKDKAMQIDITNAKVMDNPPYQEEDIEIISKRGDLPYGEALTEKETIQRLMEIEGISQTEAKERLANVKQPTNASYELQYVQYDVVDTVDGNYSVRDAETNQEIEIVGKNHQIQMGALAVMMKNGDAMYFHQVLASWAESIGDENYEWTTSEMRPTILSDTELRLNAEGSTEEQLEDGRCVSRSMVSGVGIIRLDD